MNAFKALLVIGMMAGHGVDMLTADRGFLLRSFSLFVRLITFSGFFFYFGYVFNLAHGNKTVAFNKKLCSALCPLYVYCISAFA